MPNVFETKDRNGIRIYCTEEQWSGHIVLNHGVMEHNVEAVIETIQAPDIILQSHDTNPPLDDRRIYTKESEVATYHPKIPYTKVVVSVCGGSGEVITAFASKSMMGGSDGGEAIYVAEK